MAESTQKKPENARGSHNNKALGFLSRTHARSPVRNGREGKSRLCKGGHGETKTRSLRLS